MARDMADVVRDARKREREELRDAQERLAPIIAHVTTLADLRSGSVAATMLVRGMPINIEYDPDGMTLEALQRASALANGDNQDVSVIADFITTTIRAWDVRESADGDVIPLTLERLAKFGVGLLTDIAQALVQVTRMGEANGTPSRLRSLPTRTKARRGSSRR